MINFYGFYELDTDGSILYADNINSENSEDMSSDMSSENLVGQNIFNSVLRFQNVDELKQNFQSFVSSGQTTTSFVFNAKTDEAIVSLKVMLVRVWQNLSSLDKALYFLYIKP